MALRKMPNGAYVDVPDNITPEGMAKVAARYQAAAPTKRDQIVARAAARTGNGMTQRMQEDEADVAGKVKALQSSAATRVPIIGDAVAGVDSFVHNYSMGADDVVAAGGDALTAGFKRAWDARDLGEIPRTYSNNRQALKRFRGEQADDHKVANLVGTVGGILKNPVGAETGLGKLAGKGLDAVAKVGPRAATGVQRVRAARDVLAAGSVSKTAAKMANSTIGTGMRAGFNQGFATSLMDTGDLGDATNSGLLNGAVGGAAAGAIGAFKGLGRIAKAQSADEASNVAYDRIASMLSRSEDPVTKKALTPGAVHREIRATDNGGGDARVMDMTPEAQSWASYLSKQPGMKGASHLINESVERLEGRADRFDARVRAHFGVGKGDPDAYQNVKDITAGRRAAGTRDFSEDVMNRQLAWNDGLEHFFTKNNPFVQDALRHAERFIQGSDGDVSQLTFATGKNTLANTTMQERPSMAVMDKVKDGFNKAISDAMSAGDRHSAAVYSDQLGQLKKLLAEVNPEYGQALANQRDFFQRASSTELGTNVLKMLKGGQARELLDDIQKPGVKVDDFKVGLADALMHLREKGDDPVKLMRQIMRSPDQRAALTHMFGGHRELNEFERFMRRETRAAYTDTLVKSGRQMAANLLKEPGEGGATEALADMGKAGVQGLAFGGPPGVVSRVLHSAGAWGKTMSPHAKTELAGILGGKGKGLREGVAQAEKRKLIRARKDARHAKLAGKGMGTFVNGYADQGD